MTRRRAIAIGFLLASGLAACSTSSPRSADRGVTDQTSTSTTTTRPAAYPSATGVIAFDGGDKAEGPLVRYDPATGRDTELLPGRLYLPRLSPDGRMLAYVASGEHGTAPEAGPSIHVRSMLDAGDRELSPGGCASWTLDGRSLVVGVDGGLRVVPLRGRSKAVPGGKDGDCGSQFGPGRFLLTRTDDHIDLLIDGERRTVATLPGGSVLPGVLDPTGRWLAYPVTGSADVRGLYVLDDRTLGLTRVLDDEVFGAAWSPDGKTLALSLRVPATGRRELWFAAADGTNLRPAMPGRSPVNAPTWAPDPTRSADAGT